MSNGRIPIGTYPLWIARLLRWGLSKRFETGITILLRGRGPRHGSRAYRQSLPLARAKRATLYVIDSRWQQTKAKRARSEATVQQFLEARRERLNQIERRPLSPETERNHPLNAWEKGGER